MISHEPYGVPTHSKECEYLKTSFSSFESQYLVTTSFKGIGVFRITGETTIPALDRPQRLLNTLLFQRLPMLVSLDKSQCIRVLQHFENLYADSSSGRYSTTERDGMRLRYLRFNPI